MLGRGVKRKWSCLEELEAEGLPAAAAASRDEKERDGEEEEETREEEEEEELEEEEEGLVSETSHLQQRQRVLGLCLEKLQRYQAGVELSLRRSVLLINTLRQIQDDMRSDGPAALGGPDAVLPDSRLLRDDFRDDMPVTCPGCAEGDADGDALSLSRPPSPPEFPTATTEQKPLPAAAASAFSDAVNAMGYLSDLALDDIFEDIDTSMYETSELPSPWAPGSLWPVSVSLWAAADEDAKARPSAAGTTLQSCLMDLNELDHIMEILVKS